MKAPKKPARAAKPPEPPVSPQDRLLDAAERLLITVGHDAVTTRLVGEEAGLNHGLVHYYFGSMEELFLRVLERFTARLVVRQRAMYAADTSFLVKWRKAMGFLEEDLAMGYPKILLELQAMGWNRPPMQRRVMAALDEWRKTLRAAFTNAMEGYGISDGTMTPEAMVALVMTFNQGIMVERLSGVSEGHAELLRCIDVWLSSLEARSEGKGKGKGKGKAR